MPNPENHQGASADTLAVLETNAHLQWMETHPDTLEILLDLKIENKQKKQT